MPLKKSPNQIYLSIYYNRFIYISTPYFFFYLTHIYISIDQSNSFYFYLSIYLSQQCSCLSIAFFSYSIYQSIYYWLSTFIYLSINLTHSIHIYQSIILYSYLPFSPNEWVSYQCVSLWHFHIKITGPFDVMFAIKTQKIFICNLDSEMLTLKFNRVECVSLTSIVRICLILILIRKSCW